MIDDASFMAEQVALEAAYLAHDDELLQSGYGGGLDRWVAERSPLVDAIVSDGTFLDIGCANGRLARDVERWAAERGWTIEAWGVDLGPRLVELARGSSADPDRFVAANAWEWSPDRRWTYVYALVDQSPPERLAEWIRRLLGWVEPGGRLVVGSYGSRSRMIEPEPVHRILEAAGFTVAGRTVGGTPVTSRFAWVDA